MVTPVREEHHCSSAIQRPEPMNPEGKPDDGGIPCSSQCAAGVICFYRQVWHNVLVGGTY